MRINIALNTRSIDKAIKQLEEYQANLATAGAEITRRLSLMGYDVIYQVMAGHVFSGETIDSLTIVEQRPNKHILMANSTAILFFEFGAGINGVGHPQAGEFGFGAGTYPGQKHALDPNGWWFPTDNPDLIIRTDKDGQGWGHSNGNPPYMPFYQASRKMRDDLLEVAKEVLQGD